MLYMATYMHMPMYDSHHHHQGTPLSSFRESSAASSLAYNGSYSFIHTVLLSGLQPYTVYEWYTSNTNCSGCQQIPVAKFKTSLPSGNTTSYTIGVFGDLGLMGVGNLVNTVLGDYYAAGLDNSGKGKVVKLPPGATNQAYDPYHNTMISINRSVTNEEIDFMMHVGDIGYADYVYNLLPPEYFLDAKSPNSTISTASNQLHEAVTEAYFDQIQPFTSQRAYMVAPGNHEATCSNGRNLDLCLDLNFTSYNARWSMPSETSKGVMNMFYSFDYGMTHFVVLNSETDFPLAPAAPSGQYSGKKVDPNGQGQCLLSHEC
jgi:hypothetical protein